MRDWLAASGITSGPLFRSVRGTKLGGPLDGREVSRIVQRAAKRANIKVESLSGHSLRAGLVTTSVDAGKSVHSIMAQTRHKSVASVYRYYRRSGVKLFEDNASSGIGLQMRNRGERCKHGFFERLCVLQLCPFWDRKPTTPTLAYDPNAEPERDDEPEALELDADEPRP